MPKETEEDIDRVSRTSNIDSSCRKTLKSLSRVLIQTLDAQGVKGVSSLLWVTLLFYQ